MMEQLVLMTNTKLLEPHHLPLNKQLADQVPTSLVAGKSCDLAPAEGANALNIVDMEQRMVAKALERTQGNVTRAAELLGMSRDTLRYRIEKYRISIAD